MKGFIQSKTFYYRDDKEYVAQLDNEIQRICGRRLEHYERVRARYGLKRSAFCMRLIRFIRAGGEFPRVLGPKGKKIIEMAVTPALDWWLRKPAPRK